MKKSRAKVSAYNKPHATAQPFLAHLHELRRRLFFIVVSVLIGGGVAYSVEHQLIDALLKPAEHQQFIYTSPGGGMDFLFRVCLYAGLVVSIPVILYQILKFVEPALKLRSTTYIAKVTAVSAVLAVVGILFGYFVGLPNALHFLLNQFTTQQIKPLVTIQEYMSFVSMYMLGSALLLQTPLVLVFINHFIRLKPAILMRQQKWVVLGAVTGSFIMNPTPNVMAQMMVAVPIVASYYIGVAIVWYVNRLPNRSPKIVQLMQSDLAARNERLLRAEQASHLFQSPEFSTDQKPARQQVSNIIS